MEKLFCGECMQVVDKPHNWIEAHGEPMSGCECGNGLMEVDPCKICGEYPEDEYEEGELENGICKSCFHDGIDKYFMEYLDYCGPEMGQAFYLGMAFQYEHGYAFTVNQLLDLCKREYNAYLQSEYNNPKDIFATHLLFITENDTGDFEEWLIEREKKERE